MPQMVDIGNDELPTAGIKRAGTVRGGSMSYAFDDFLEEGTRRAAFQQRPGQSSPPPGSRQTVMRPRPTIARQPLVRTSALHVSPPGTPYRGESLTMRASIEARGFEARPVAHSSGQSPARDVDEVVASFATPIGSLSAPGVTENVLGCVETALLKLGSKPGHSLAHSGFTMRVLPAVIRSVRAQLSFEEEARQMLSSEAEFLKETLVDKEIQFEHIQGQAGQHCWVPRREVLKSEAQLQAAESRAGSGEARLQVADAERLRLRTEVGDMLRSSENEWQEKQEELDRRLAELREACDAKEQALAQQNEELNALRAEADKRGHEVAVARQQHILLNPTETKLRDLQASWAELQQKLHQLRLSGRRGKRRQGRHNDRSPGSGSPRGGGSPRGPSKASSRNQIQPGS